MTDSATTGYARGRRSVLPLPPAPLIGYLLKFVAVAVIAVVTVHSLQASSVTAQSVNESTDILEQLQAVLSSLQDVETGQRGFLLTQDDSYLKPYQEARTALPVELARLRSLTGSRPDQLRRLDTLEQLTKQKLAEVEQTVSMIRSGNVNSALKFVRTDGGRELMERTRASVTDIERSARQLLSEREASLESATRLTYTVLIIGSAVLILLIFASSVMTSRDYRARETQAWLRTGQNLFAARIVGEQRLDVLGNHVLEFLAGYLDAKVGALYLVESDSRLRRFAGYAVAPDQARETLLPGEGLLGQAARDKRAVRVRDVPDGYLRISSSLGSGKVRELLVAPATSDGAVQGVVELGFMRPLEPTDQELLERISEALAVAVRSSRDRTQLEDLLAQTQRQAEELQTQQEELRVSNEELEVQTRALKETQQRLEHQQSELEQTNSQLEEQARTLETQRDELSRAQVVLAEKAAELERTNQYKSEFLANMSHELRTPLNSTLILAKLLADNKAGNLTEEQVKFATTISSAGNELLGLINDILDLSRIEAGRLEVHAETVAIAKVVESHVQTFEPLAREKGLAFTATIEPDTPESLQTDAQRLGQILKNLLSNAMKFTERGAVALNVAKQGEGIAFTVRDTGIGIPAHQQGLIFEAFRQADGSTHRKYGGSGLGLSISRDLARLLGGEVTVHSEPNAGSSFTLTLPLVLSAARGDGSHARSERPAAPVSPQPPPPRRAERRARNGSGAGVRADLRAIETADDRECLSPSSRAILIVEDDVRFAEILRDLAHEMGFQCIITHSADQALLAATTYQPSAIVLDVNLPDHSGLGVLDQLKHDPRTRHIPVHVASVADFSHEALELGAVGYMLKPVTREALVEAFRRLEAKLAQSVRRVLVIEDDERQRESIARLLANDDVQIMSADTAAGAFTQLQSISFDCVVMDLNLPDLSGYELLEKMAQHDDVSFPPVIVYTGRSLTPEEEQKLRRYSHSIIIKDARSPERLLDEVTLFLHQVEAKLPTERQRMLKAARDRESMLDGRRVLVVEDDARNIFALSSLLEPKGIRIEIARNGKEALQALTRAVQGSTTAIDLVLMDIMMPEMDGLTAMQEIRKRPEWAKLPIIALTAKARKDDQEKCLAAGANDYIAKPLDVERLLSLVRVWMPR